MKTCRRSSVTSGLLCLASLAATLAARAPVLAQGRPSSPPPNFLAPVFSVSYDAGTPTTVNIAWAVGSSPPGYTLDHFEFYWKMRANVNGPTRNTPPGPSAFKHLLPNAPATATSGRIINLKKNHNHFFVMKAIYPEARRSNFCGTPDSSVRTRPPTCRAVVSWYSAPPSGRCSARVRPS